MSAILDRLAFESAKATRIFHAPVSIGDAGRFLG